MRVERAIFRPSAEHATPRGVEDFFADVFAALEASPRELRVELDFREAAPAEPIVLDLVGGEPVWRQAGRNAAHGRLRGRWLALHAVPLPLPRGIARFRLSPASGNRIKVRSQRCWLKSSNS